MRDIARLEEFDLRVRLIKFHREETSLTVFDAVVLKWRPIKKDWQETKQRIVCVGHFYGLVENDHLHVEAEEFEDPRYGPQYQIYTSKRIEPGTELELKKFLTSIKGVGPKNAERLISEHGMDTISTVLRDPSSLNRLGLNKLAKENLYQVIVENQAYEELLLFLQLYGVPAKYTAQIYKAYGRNAPEKIRDNPYALYWDEVIEFQVADRLNHALGGNANYRYRISAGLLACLRDDSERNGNVFTAREGLGALLRQFLKRSLSSRTLEMELLEADIEEALRILADNKYVVVDSFISDSPAIYLTQNFYAEQSVAKCIFALVENPKRFYAAKQDIQRVLREIEAEKKLKLAIEQGYAVETALCSPISILTGGPGTGKTQTLTMITQAIKRLSPEADIRVCAPTGKAAVRVQELSGLEASTIHRLIGYPNEILQEDELLCDYVIADEFSMSDIQLCSWLFHCVWSGARVLIVGDHEQLPSVGPGLVLRDLIESGCIPVTKLQTVFRQASGSKIISNAHAIIKASKEQDLELEYSKARGGDFYFVEASSQSRISERIQKSVERLISDGFPLEQIAILSPVHGGIIGSDHLNIVLQEMMNAGAPGYQLERNLDLRLGDKVIQCRNNYNLRIFNGETGVIKAIDYSPGKAVLVSYPDKDVWYDAEQVEDLDLAYAITTHRSQGSEFQVVIIPIHETILHNMNRNLLYTAITRAKQRVIFVGTKSALAVGLKKDGVLYRNSNLILRLQTQLFAI